MDLPTTVEWPLSESTTVEWPWSRRVLRRFGVRTAIIYVDCAGQQHVCSYHTLVEMATRVAAFVLSTGPGAAEDEGNVERATSGVGLCLDNGLAMAVCQLGALWAGQSFVPLAIDRPSIRLQLQSLLEARRISVVLCQPTLLGMVEAIAAHCNHCVAAYAIDDLELTSPSTARLCMAGLPMGSHSSTSTNAVPEEARRRFCTFHTSGTTGTPKPVHSSYAEFSAFATAAAAPYRLTSTSRIFVATSHIFDPSAVSAVTDPKT